MKHTPGPWVADGSVVEHFEAPFKADICVCSVGMVASLPKASTETEANARLIAAAPELLEACKKWEKLAHEAMVNNKALEFKVAEDLRPLQEVIAKVEGEL